jgi:hypothetical protein
MTRRVLLTSVAGLFLRPNEPTRKNLNVSIAPALLARIEEEARAENITADEFLRRAVEDYLAWRRRRQSLLFHHHLDIRLQQSAP